MKINQKNFIREFSFFFICCCKIFNILNRRVLEMYISAAPCQTAALCSDIFVSLFRIFRLFRMRQAKTSLRAYAKMCGFTTSWEHAKSLFAHSKTSDQTARMRLRVARVIWRPTDEQLFWIWKQRRPQSGRECANIRCFLSAEEEGDCGNNPGPFVRETVHISVRACVCFKSCIRNCSYTFQTYKPCIFWCW